jgi:hypothetical protein
MPPSKYRPSKVEGETRRYNVLFRVKTLDALKRFTDETKTSPASFVRGAVEEALSMPIGASRTPQGVAVEETSSKGYRDGVEDACARLAKNSRLALKMSNGMSMGEDIAARIRKDLLKHPSLAPDEPFPPG